MSNTLLSPTAITREALRLLVNNLVFARSINRQYDNQFANSGATMSGKIGPSLRIRMPNRYLVSTGAALQLQDTTEQYQTFTVSTRKQVALYFTAEDLTLTIDEFAKRYLETATAQLANQIDYDALQCAVSVYNNVGTYAAGVPAGGSKAFLNAGALLDCFGVPRDGKRVAVVGPDTQAALVEALKGLFQSSAKISEQYESGEMGTGLGFKFKMDQNVGNFTVGTRVASADYTVDGTQTEGASVILITGTTGKTIKAGDRFTVADTYSVNPMNRQKTGKLAWFVATAAATEVTGTHYSVPIAPAMIASTSNPYQTIDLLPANGKAVVFAGTAAGNYPLDIAFHQDAFSLVTADLEVPNGVDFAKREVVDGISLRIVRDYDINNDSFPCRIDVLYGVKCIRPELACILIGNVA